MKSLKVILAVVLLPFVLAACQGSNSAVSSYSGKELSKKPVSKRVQTKRVSTRQSARQKKKIEFVRVAMLEPSDSSTATQSFIYKRVPEANKNRARTVQSKKTLKRKARKSALRSRPASSRRSTTRKFKAARKTTKAKRSRTAVAKRSRTAVKRKATKRRNTKVASRKKGKRSSRGRYNALITKYARANGVPVRLAHAVVQVESSYKANARGAAGEIGLMQIMPRTARGIGYRGPLRNLYKPSTNLRFGMKYLGKAYRLGGRSTCGAILKYNAGHGAKRMNPISRNYCKKVARILRRG